MKGVGELNELSAFDVAQNEFNSKPIVEKLRISKVVRDKCSGVSLLRLDGYVKVKTDMGLELGDGPGYVYMWCHMGGDPFYVGSGIDDRWKNLNGRPDGFYAELDRGDAVIYKVVSGASVGDARKFERYISLVLGKAGFILTNGDNSPHKGATGTAEKWIREFELNVGKAMCDDVYRVLDGIIRDEKFGYGDIMASKRFLLENGANYFSERYVAKE